jgi:hypothetical protein
MITTVLPDNVCPSCGAPIVCASHETARPKPGDLSLCFTCGAAMRFTEDLRLDLVDLDALQIDPRQLQQIRSVQRDIRNRTASRN